MLENPTRYSTDKNLGAQGGRSSTGDSQKIYPLKCQAGKKSKERYKEGKGTGGGRKKPLLLNKGTEGSLVERQHPRQLGKEREPHGSQERKHPWGKEDLYKAKEASLACL